MARTRRSYTKEFKAQAVKLVVSGQRSVRKVAQEMGIPPASLVGWVRNARDGESRVAEAKAGVDQQELQRLRRENEQLRMERDFLKKAAAFFAKENT